MAKFREKLHNELSSTLHYAVNLYGGVPGVVAVLTDEKGNIFENAVGKLSIDKDENIKLNSIFNIFSITKTLTATIGMQLVEKGLINLDEPAKKYVSAIKEIPLLKGFDKDNKPILSKPINDISIRDLFLHTSGFGYEFFNKEDELYRQHNNIPSVISNTFDSLKSVLLFEPGSKWNYGIGIDWLGKVIENVYNDRLANVMKKYLFEPCGMSESVFDLTQELQNNLVVIHFRDKNGSITPNHEFLLPNPTPMDMGGHGVHSSALDYAKFIRAILNDGMGENGRILKAETIDFMCKSGIEGFECKGWKSANEDLANKSANEFFPNTKKGWGYSFQINEEEASTGAPAGTLRWAGISNLFFFIDRKNKIGGFWGSAILPFIDIASYQGYLSFESAIYRNLLKEV